MGIITLAVIIVVIVFLFIIAVFATASSKRREKAELEALREKGKKSLKPYQQKQIQKTTRAPRRNHFSASIYSRKKMSRAAKLEKKDFWDMSWNPVWGCINNCPYCYAQRIAKTYWKQIYAKELQYHNSITISGISNIRNLRENLQDFKPAWLESNYVRRFPRKPSIIFVNSMSDPAYWEQEWYEKIVSRIAENMQHTFVVLTKQPKVYKKYHFPHNTIIGVTCTTQLMLNQFECDLSNWFEPNNRLLLSIEPIQEKIKLSLFMKRMILWIHIGQESGNRKERIVATPEMIEPFFDLDTRVFMKKNLEGVVPGRKLRRERI